MAETKAHIRTIAGMQSALGWVGTQTLTIGRSQAAGGDGLGFRGGQVLALAVGACFYNNLYFLADERGIKVKSVELEVTSGWTAEPMVSTGILVNARVEAEAKPAEIEALIRYAGQISTVSNSIRQGTSVTIGDLQVVPVSG